MKPTASRVDGYGPSAFGEMTLLAQKVGAVNLGQGFPDFQPEAFVLEAVREAFAAGVHQYAPPKGWPRLQRAISGLLASQLGFTPDPDTEVTITVGATQALYSSMQAILNPADETIVMLPKFDTYTPQIELAGSTPVYVALEPTPSGWALDLEQLRAAITNRTKLLMLNTPHNPTGKVFSVTELEGIAQIALEFDLYVIADEVYDRLFFERPHVSIASLPGMRERTITIGSAGKIFGVTGWRIGWTVASPDVTAAIRRGAQWVPFAAATPVQEAIAIALERMGPMGYETALRQDFQRKRDFLCASLTRAGFKPWIPEGSYYIVADASNLTDDPMAFSRWMVTEAKLAAMPGNIFYPPETASSAPPFFRFAFCKTQATLDAAAEHLEFIGRSRNA
jgi:aspartate/methionine/tyrosine aminotransferase